MAAERTVSVVAHGRRVLALGWLLCFWHALLLNAIVYWVIVAGGVVIALDGNVRPDLVRPIAHAVGIPVAILICGGLFWWNVSRLSRAYLCIEGTEVIFRGQVAWRGVIERRYQFNELASVTLGQPLNPVERCFNWLGAELVQVVKEGRLFVTDIYGERVTFQFMNLAFHLPEVQAFIAELNRRGIRRATALQVL